MVLNTVAHELSEPCFNFVLLFVSINVMRSETLIMSEEEVCNNTTIEPALQPISGETISNVTAISEDGARLDIVADGFWGFFERTFLDVCVFNPLASSNSSQSLAATYHKH